MSSATTRFLGLSPRSGSGEIPVITTSNAFRRLFSTALVAAACLGVGAATASEPIVVGDAVTQELLHPDVMEESVAHIDPAKVLERFDAPNMFTASPDRIVNAGFSANALWLHVRLQWDGGGTRERVITIENPLLHNADFYLRHADGRVDILSQKDAEGAPQASLQLPAPGVTQDLFVRVESHHPLILPLKLSTPQAYAGHREWTRMQTGLIAGALLALVVYNLLLAIALRKRNYRWLALHLFSFGVLLVIVQGYGESAWKSLVGTDADNLIYAAISFAMFGIFGYASSLLSLKKAAPLAATTFGVLALVRVMLMGLALLVPASWVAQLCVALLVPESMIIAGTALVLAFKGSSPARLLLLAWTPLLTLLVADALLSFGVLPSMGFGTAGLAMGGLIGAAVITFASVLRYESLNEQVETVTLKSATKLETGVAERTRALATTMAALNDANLRLREANERDGLTGAYNRRYFDQNIEAMISRSRTATQPFSALVADIDHFKQINDKAGHLAGDDCIRMVARLLQQSLGNGQPVVRYGGEEFVILLPDVNAGEAFATADRLRAAIADETVHSGNQTLKLTISIGVATIPAKQRVSAASVIRAADSALYAAKNEGRNRVIHHGAITRPAIIQTG